MASGETVSQSVEEYLQAIRRLSLLPGRVSTTRLARQLGVTPASVTGMLHRLADLGLISYRRYRRISLTPEGEHLAQGLIRRHRLTERLLTNLLDVPLHEAHQEACRLEHAVSPALESRLADKLGAFAACPHGHPIDASRAEAGRSLLEAPLQRPLTIVSIEDESPEAVRHLAERGLLPGASIEVISRDPRDDALVLDVGGRTEALGRRVAAGIRVRSHRRKR